MRFLERVRIALLRVLMRTVGRLSDGVRLCLAEGLTSGKMVDYVYRNRPSGRLGLGRWIDRRFLAHSGWEAVRARRDNLETLLLEAIESLRAAGRRVSMVDIASGPALYVLSVLSRAGGDDVRAVCRDLDKRWLREGEAEAARRGLAQRVRYERGDAFAADELAALEPRPNLAVASGFYDWIGDDDEVRRSLGILFDVLATPGELVLTNQTAHPDLAMVSGVFTGFDRRPLAMRMRSAAQIEGWLGEAGFRVERSLVDSGGFYSVTRARKP